MIVKRHLDEKLSWFPECRFGMFVHFGLYALLGRGEWVMYHEDIPREEYAKLMARFNPRRFDADQWVQTAQRAGARYITVTAKHHDGFCLFDSELTEFKSTRTPFGRDLIGELADACHRENMRLVLYYSQPDWRHPNFVHREGAFKDLQYARADDQPNWRRYLDYVEGQVEELCTRYGRIDGIWFDGVHKTEGEWRGRRLYRMIKEHQPGAVVNERAGCGDFFTPERSLAAAPSAAGYAIEACQSISCDAWGHYEDARLFSSPHLIRSLVRMAAAGGNYLLNIAPKPDGSLPADQVRRLEEIGAWLEAHGKAIYGTDGCPTREEPEDVVYTRRGKRVYAHLLRWPEADSVALRGLRVEPKRARLLSTNTRLRVESSEGAAVIRGLPSTPPDAAVNVIELVFDDERVFRAAPRPAPAIVHDLEAGKALVLGADTARRRGFGPKGSVLGLAKGGDGEPCLSGWSSAEQKASWVIESGEAAACEVSVEMACPALYSGSAFTVSVGGRTLRGTVPATKGNDDFARVELGALEIPPGRCTLTLAPGRLNYGYVFATVRRVILRPLRGK